MRRYFYPIFLGLIVALALVLRTYKLDRVAPGISWDEATVGYNAYTIFHWGKDEWGRTLPITFKSFEDYKNPVHIYLTVPFVGLFGLNEWTTRLSSSLFGVLNVVTIFLLGSILFKSQLVGLIASFILAISPYNIQFSRFNHELNFAMFFFAFGIYLLFKALESRKPRCLLLSFLFLGIDLLTYQSAKVVTPALVFFLILLNFKKLKVYKKYFISGLLIYFLFASLLFIKPELLGGARFKQNEIREELIKNTPLYQKTNNMRLGFINVVFDRYVAYFGNIFLFESGDPIPRHSAQVVGTFYKIDLPFLILGFLYLLYSALFKKKFNFLFLLVWCLIAPIPGAVSSSFAHAARAMFMTISWHLVIATGIYCLLGLLKNNKLKISVAGLIIIGTFLFLTRYLEYYYGEFSTRYGTEWQYGMRDIVQYVERHPEFYTVYMTDAHSQPYIFFLYYLKTPLPEFLSTVKYNNTSSRPSNLVSGFSRYKFGMWDQIESYPNSKILYIVNPSKYDGLRFKDKFTVMKKIEYPNEVDAFFIINGLI